MSYCDNDSYNKKAIKLEKFTLLRMRRDANKTLKCYQVSEKIHGSDSVLDWSLYLNLRLRNFKRKKHFTDVTIIHRNRTARKTFNRSMTHVFGAQFPHNAAFLEIPSITEYRYVIDDVTADVASCCRR